MKGVFIGSLTEQFEVVDLIVLKCILLLQCVFYCLRNTVCQNKCYCVIARSYGV